MAPTLVGALWLAVLAATLAPLLAADLPPGADILNHVARGHVLARLTGDADLQRFYTSDWSVIPNMANDLLMLGLLKLMTPYQAGRVIVGLAIVTLFAGVALLRHQVTGRVGLLPLATALFAYNAAIAIGLVNFTLGAGLAVLGVAAWLATGRWAWPARLLAAGVIAVGLFFVHLMALGAYGLILGLMRLDAFRRDPRLEPADMALVGQFLVPVVLWFQVPAPSHGTLTTFGGAWSRLDAVASPVMFFNDFDLAAAAVLLILLVWGLARRYLVLAPVLVAPVIGLALVSLAMPAELFGIWLTHVRFPLLAALLVLAGLEVRLDDRRLTILLTVTLALVGGLRLDKVHDRMQRCDSQGRAFMQALDVVPRGARLLPVIEPAAETGDCLFSGYWHMPSLAVIERSVFFPLMFVHLQPLDIRQPYRHLIQEKARPATPMMLAGQADPMVEAAWNAAIVDKWRREFDVVAWLHPGVAASPPPEGLRRIGGGDFFTLYEVRANP